MPQRQRVLEQHVSLMLICPNGVETPEDAHSHIEPMPKLAAGYSEASRRRIDAADLVAVFEGFSARRTKDGPLHISLDVGVGDGLPRLFAGFHCPLLNCAVNHAQVVDASHHLGSFAGGCVVWDSYRREQPDDRDHDHDLDQREARSPVCVFVFHMDLFCKTT